MSREVSLFVPGRLCLAGEHSDWAASYRTETPSISPGAALVVGLRQGIRATASRTSSVLTLSSSLAGPLSIERTSLTSVSRSSSPWRFSAAVAFVIRQRYGVTGLSLNVTEESLPAGKGLSSSAAVCVLTARAFNQLYDLRLTTAGEMDIAYAAERLTGSACGRMDQVVAVGPGRVARMEFDGELVEHQVLQLREGNKIYVVLADLGKGKDTRTILAGLHRAFPERATEDCKELQDVLGDRNFKLIAEMEEALVKGHASRLGELFIRAQKSFDEAAIPFCPDELLSPALHEILADADVQRYTYGGKGVGSQGDGAVQFVAKDHQSAVTLTEILQQRLGTEPYIVKVGGEFTDKTKSEIDSVPTQITSRPLIHTAVIPAAGFGTRLFPASRSIRPKALFPIVDKDGFAKPLLLHLVEQCAMAGITRVIIVTGPGDQKERVQEIFSPVPSDLYKALKPVMRDYADKITRLSSIIEIAVQQKPRGFGDAVACARVEDDCPFVLLLGDVVFMSPDSEKSCLVQAINAFEKDPSRSVIGVTQVPVSTSISYGVVGTAKEDFGRPTRVPIREIVEKPSSVKAEELSHDGKCNIVLGPYVFTSALLKELRKDVAAGQTLGGEIQLSTAMIRVYEKEGMDSLCLNGEALDTGNAVEYVQTLSQLTAFPR